jgi:putative FmdB family regulatory protein
MPTYEYLCDKCEHYFTKFTSISTMNLAEEEPCPNCAEIAVKKVMLTAPAIGDAVRLHIRRPDNGFREVLQKIHEKTPGSRINNNSSYI